MLDNVEQILSEIGTIEIARDCIKYLSPNATLCAFDIIGRDYLGGESAFFNDFDGICDLIEQFELQNDEIVELLIRNTNYNKDDTYIVFDGQSLCTFDDLKYFKRMIYKKCNGECAEYIINEVK